MRLPTDKPVTDGPSARSSPHVVGIGASAGGLEALELLFAGMSESTGLAFVIVQHLSPDFPSHMPELLARHTSIPIHSVTDGTTVEPNAIYQIPPGKELLVSGGRLLLTDRPSHPVPSQPIDRFLRSLADDVQDRAVAIILSGTGSDGSRGIEHVRAAGGLVLVQRPDSARFDGMPRSAIATGAADLVLEPSAMPDVLLSYQEDGLSPRQLVSQEQDEPASETQPLFDLMNEELGLDLSQYRPATVHRRLQRRLHLHGDADVDSYLARLREEPAERTALCRDLLIGVTRFFRDAEAFERLREGIVRELVEQAGEGAQLRAWVAGCATGEEAYSLGVIFLEACARAERSLDIKIFATDVHREALATAAAGVYSEEATAEMSLERRERFFRRAVDGYRVSPELRSMVVFAPHNLLENAPFTQLDLVLCRNLLIYFERPAQRKILSLFQFGLKPGGGLLLGPSETLGDLADEFSCEDRRWKLFRKRRDAQPTMGTHYPVPSVSPLLPRAALRADRPEARGTDRGLLAIYDRLLAQYLPAAFLIDERLRLVHSFGGAERFVRVPAGRPTDNLLELLVPPLRPAVSTAVRKAIREDSSVRYRDVVAPGPDGDETLEITIERIAGNGSANAQLLVRLEPKDVPRPAPAAIDVTPDESTEYRIHTLESDLREAQQDLQTTVEQLEASNEELQTTNEELTASNEELQGTNEELHSVNEELYTVNVEHQRKIVELSDLTADMENLLTSTEVGVVFVDGNLRIRRLTPAITNSFHISQGDLGRDLTSFRHDLEHEQLAEDLRNTISSGTAVEREIADRHGSPFLLRITPYRSDSGIAGALLTVVDIASLRAAETDAELFRYIADQSHDANLLVDQRGHIVYANRAAGRLFAREPRDLRGRPTEELHEALSPESAAVTSRENDGVLLIEVRTESQATACEATIETVEFKQARYAHFVLRDVRQRLQNERRVAVEHGVSQILATAEEWPGAAPDVLRAFVEHLGVDIAECWVRPDANDPLHLLHIETGPTQSGPTGEAWRHASQTLRIDPNEDHEGLLSHAWRSGEPTWVRDLDQNPAFRRRTEAAARGLRTGLVLPVVRRGQVIALIGLYGRGPFGSDEHVSAMLTTISRQLGTFAASAENEAQLRLRDRAISAARDGILITDPRRPDNPIIYVNEGFTRMTGYSPEETIGRNCRFLQGPRTSAKLRRRLRRSLRAGEVFDGTLLNYRKDGAPFWNQLNITPVRNDRGEILNFVGIQHDVSDERRVRTELRAARKAADAANEAKSAFLANMSHEIRTPMTAILGFAEVLNAHVEGRELRKTTAAIQRNGEHLLGIIDDVLDLSKIEAGKLELRVRPTRPAPLLWKIQTMMSSRAMERGIDLRLRYATAIPEIILTDPSKVRQILVNVIGNAIKFTDEGHVEVVVSLVDGQHRLAIEVIDTGVGISAEDRERLFAPFAQGSRNTPDRFGGTGLGLSITRRLLDHLGGDIQAESEAGIGTTFTIQIPTGPLAGVAVHIPDAEPPAEDTEIPPWEPPARLSCRALVVDDQPDVRQVVEYFLCQAGATVDIATNGREAVEAVMAAAARDEPYDVVLMDIQLPVMSGYQATRAIRAEGMRLPIVALTAAAMKGERARCLRAGCDDYISKPIDGRALVEAVASRVPSAKETQDDRTDDGLCKVLLVEDNADSAEALCELLRLWGHTVEIAGTAEEAETIFRTFEPDVVVSDIELPDASGNALVARLRENHPEAGSRMIALSGRSDRRNIERSLGAGFHDYLVKPVGAAKLRAAIEAREPNEG